VKGLISRLGQFRAAALGIVLLTIAIRLPALVHPRAIDDEQMYSVVANEMVDGGRPYIDAVERKLCRSTAAARLPLHSVVSAHRLSLRRISPWV